MSIKSEYQAEAESIERAVREHLLRIARSELARKGGKASQAKRTPEERKEMARKAARVRWDKHRDRAEVFHRLYEYLVPSSEERKKRQVEKERERMLNVFYQVAEQITILDRWDATVETKSVYGKENVPEYTSLSVLFMDSFLAVALF